ncbi:hypothetical protein [Faecalicoccus pleomorphus]|uniref:hypothetical protein n=1 Tax=Faecalicoccus pleomorphus TaxID=1323 RepID=UPI001960AC31|nr:hypothetical protein [Faecalicoccus pleomorphus]MBM6807802.1 hypothetical protein [Faecalicoccus pleomorphus]
MIPAVAAPLVANAEGTQPAAEEKQIPQQIEFVLADGTVVQTSTVNLTTGAHQFSELTLPQGYELVSDGSFTVVSSADIIPVTVRAKEAVEETATVIASVQFIDADGNYAGGGNYFLPAGVQNLSILSQYVPEGYTLAEAGDFYVVAGGSYQAKVVKAASTIIHVTYKSTGGKALGGGDYFVDEDGDGIANYSELQLPEGYNLTETGDFFVDANKDYEITLKKEVEGTIINVTFVDEEGNNLGGGDYFVDLDDDGIANYSELQLPEGYELIQTGDFFVDANNPYTITLHKVQTHEVEQDTATLVVKYVKEGTNEVVGEDEAYTADGVKGEVHTFTVDLKAPKGYELVEDEDSLSLDVEYGQNAEVFVKVKAVEDKNEGKEDEEKTDAKEDSKKEDKGVDTGVAMPLAGIFGTMSVALGGMIALLRRKNRK